MSLVHLLRWYWYPWWLGGRTSMLQEHAPCIPLPKKKQPSWTNTSTCSTVLVSCCCKSWGLRLFSLTWPTNTSNCLRGRHIQGWSGLSLWYSSILNHFTMGGKEMHCLACTWGVAQKSVMTKWPGAVPSWQKERPGIHRLECCSSKIIQPGFELHAQFTIIRTSSPRR